MFSVKQIQEIIPHREPFLLLDKVLEVEPMRRGAGTKTVRVGDTYLAANTNKRVMPNVLVLEALAQLAGVVVLIRTPARESIPFYAGMQKVEFFKPVTVGDELQLKVEIVKARGSVYVVWGEASCNAAKIAQGELLFIIKA